MSLNSTIADLMLEKGRAQAQGSLGSGQAWGNALTGIGQNVGQTVANIPNVQAQQVANTQNAQIRQAQINELQQKQSDLHTLDTLYSSGGRDAVLSSVPGHMRASVQQLFD